MTSSENHNVGALNGAELPDVNINTGVQSINTERASLMILMRRRRIMAAAFPGCQHQGILLIFSSFEITMPICMKCYIGLVESSWQVEPSLLQRVGVLQENMSVLLEWRWGKLTGNSWQCSYFLFERVPCRNLGGGKGFIPLLPLLAAFSSA